MSTIEIQLIVRNHQASRHTINYKQTPSENTSIINTVQHILFHHRYSDIKTEQGITSKESTDKYPQVHRCRKS